MLTHSKRVLFVLVLVVSLFSFSAFAQASSKITLASVGWTGVTIKTDIAVSVLNSLGYDAENLMVSVPIAYKAMSTSDADAFLGNWMPSMASIADKYFEKGTVLKYAINMDGAKYTLATPTFCADAGLKDFKDIVKFGDKLDWKIYGIEAGNDGNQVIQNMIDKNMFGMGKFTLVPSSEAAMLAQVQGMAREGKWSIFLGWAPHSMNEYIDMTYLTGSTDETFGGNDGTATIWTNIRSGLVKDEPNVARLLKNMTFSVSMINQIMITVEKDDSLSLGQAGLNWVKKHPEVYKKWLEGVTTIDGKSAVNAFEASLKKQ
ncbi:glycine betaine/proline transport system substrate-binding protein [Maridesulfovibrio ferrireducens]|uniref:Glycine betaine/proline transport system substrate-binding protein n=1 Tax=Maridesulfovibrio ferrireducens TaxID=246191 RepID=A0A1G9BBI0_9BACT|nr:glycine betaine ABC transporter substrate-binding protein [Maridesulfovibrio ferrireducens]SDK36450.1 glycine betaine/proline transport system substrate-binding protein [Maridesulfovibrio ferrireducens]